MNSRPRGFTLLELVVVLAVLAILTGMAVASFTAVEDQTRFDASSRLVEDVESAILGERGLRNANNQPLINGFVADMGRLPVALDLDNNSSTPLQVSELWSPVVQETPSVLQIDAYSLRQAVSGNIPSAFNIAAISPPQTLTAISTISDVADSAVFLGTGWRGPYLRLGVGSQTLLDSWGNPLDLLRSNNTPVINANEFVFGMLSRGADYPTVGVADGYAREQGFNLVNRYRSTLTVNVRALSDSAVTPITVQLFVPDGASRIRCFRMSQTVTKVKDNLLPLPFIFPAEASDGTNTFNVCTSGLRVIRVYNGSTTSAPVPPTPSHGAPVTFTLTPGANNITLELP